MLAVREKLNVLQKDAIDSKVFCFVGLICACLDNDHVVVVLVEQRILHDACDQRDESCCVLLNGWLCCTCRRLAVALGHEEQRLGNALGSVLQQW